MQTLLSIAVQVFLMATPWFLRRKILSRLFGYQIHERAKIGLSIVMARRVVMAEGSVIRSLTMIKGLDDLTMGLFSRIGAMNWVSGFPSGTSSLHFHDQMDRQPSLRLGDHSSITGRHIIDCTARVQIGHHSTFAGYRSQILTHSINIVESRQRAQPVLIGDYCFVGTGSILLGGCTLPDYSVLGAGSVLNKAYTDSYTLYAGSPARPIKSLPKELGYFCRENGAVV